MKFLALALSSLLTFSAYAGDHAAGSIKGTGINLFEHNHSFAGEISGTPAFGVFDEANFVADVNFRRGTETVGFKIADANGSYTGSIVESRTGTDGKSIQVSTSVTFGKAMKTGANEGQLILNIDGQDVTVNIKAESFANNHFHKPTYSAVLNGQAVEFTFTGEACFGYSANLTMMILGTMAHLAK